MSISSSHHYAVFLCHNSKDKPIVRIIHQSLRQEYDLPTYIDESDLVGGEEWEKSIHAALSSSKTCAILIGGNGWGGYQLEGEAKPALARMAKDPTFRVIPVLLPDANPEALLDLREFFQRTHWVDFRSIGERAAIRALASAVRGENPFPEGRPELTPMRVSFDSIRWDVSKRLDASVLYAGQQLREAWALRAERPADFDDLAVAFLSASEDRQNEELGRGLAAHAAALVNNPSQAELAANLALEAMQRFPTPQAHGVLSLARTRLPMVTARFEHPAPVNAVAMSPAETWMATGCQDGGVAFRDEHQFVMAGSKHSAPVRTAVFDPDNAWLATGDNDGSVVIWDLERREPRLTLSLGDAVTKLEVRPGRDGSLLLASSGRPGHPGNVSVWSAAEWKQLWTGSKITDATFDASGAHV
ncbi:MAG TPA: TIR domain-containing protein, partial [Pyrinomonadaceae bacterium]|nr:TIR domain-containing protein [Pyrinomonadaceae bacterium]